MNDGNIKSNVQTFTSTTQAAVHDILVNTELHSKTHHCIDAPHPFLEHLSSFRADCTNEDENGYHGVSERENQTSLLIFFAIERDAAHENESAVPLGETKLYEMFWVWDFI